MTASSFGLVAGPHRRPAVRVYLRTPDHAGGQPTSLGDGGDALLLTVPEACAALRISRWSFYRLLRQRQLTTVKIGSRRLVPAGALQALVQELTRQGDA